MLIAIAVSSVFHKTSICFHFQVGLSIIFGLPEKMFSVTLLTHSLTGDFASVIKL